MTEKLRKYLAISHDYPPAARFGQGTQAALVSQGLALRGHEVDVAVGPIAPDSGAYVPTPGVHEVRPSLDGLDPAMRVTDRRMFWHLELNRRLLGMVLANSGAPAVVHNHGCESSPLACFLAEHWSVPLVSAVHVVEELFDEAQGSSRPRGHDRFVQKALEVNGFTRSDLIIAPNEYVASRLSDIYPGSADRIFVIPHPRSNDVLPKSTWERNTVIRAIYVGRLISYKGIVPLLSALSLLEKLEVQLTVVGDGPERDIVLERQAAGIRIEWIRHARHDALLDMYPTFDMAVLPSILETHSMVLHEAMQCGLPVIAADVEPMRSLAANGNDAILVPVHKSGAGVQADAFAIAEAMTELAASTALRERYGRAARTRALGQPDAAEYAELLDQAIE